MSNALYFCNYFEKLFATARQIPRVRGGPSQMRGVARDAGGQHIWLLIFGPFCIKAERTIQKRVPVILAWIQALSRDNRLLNSPRHVTRSPSDTSSGICRLITILFDARSITNFFKLHRSSNEASSSAHTFLLHSSRAAIGQKIYIKP